MLLHSVLANSNSTSSNNNKDVSFMLENPQVMMKLLQRRKRWLVYELGSMLFSLIRPIVGLTPRGCTWTTELTLIYSLPAGTTDWIPRRRRKRPTAPPIPPPPKPPSPPPMAPPAPPTAAPPVSAPLPPPPVGVAPIIVPYNPSSPTQPFILAYPQESPVASGRRNSNTNRAQFSCQGSDLYKDQYGTYFCRPSTVNRQHRRLVRQLEDEGIHVANDSNNPQGMLFDIIAWISTVYNYNQRYCIMRMLCESRHLILPPGKDLFHDVFRILLRQAYPEIAHKTHYREAFTAGHSLHKCSSLYGPHCKHSFLLELVQHFQPNRKG
ncbi:CASP-like protein 4A1 [Scaptodrosophila lebanonensis]|uniref:CASP-like protein 4A1 n=1 Tax=Drosophila lebanonensis TaxID=7225 RepID=A0A6J2TMF2_DROLE|nr:CASP-like protein 4A1 [Scaptodrosophila lebanonensis]